MALEYVGGIVGNRSGSTSTGITLDLTGLSGGIGSAALAGDLVIIAVSTGSSESNTQGIDTAGYTTISTLYANDNNDTNLYVGYKLLSGSPDTSVVTVASGSTSDGQSAVVHVWRGVHPDVFDVTTQTAIGFDIGKPTPPEITPVTSGVVIICVGAAAALATSDFTVGSLSNFISDSSADSYDSATGIGSYAWTSGTYTPAQWSGTTSSWDSWAAVTMALKPYVRGKFYLTT